LVSPFAFEGTCDAEVFNTYLFRILKPVLREDSVIILDNASFHRASKIEQLCKEVGCKVLFLPPYSPDLNKIEGYWVQVKTRLRKLLRDTEGDLMNLITDIFMAMNKIA
jgi:transposase